MPEVEARKSLTVKLNTDLLNRFNAAVKLQGLKNQFVVEQLVSEYVEKVSDGFEYSGLSKGGGS
jgi:hypothetical protein